MKNSLIAICCCVLLLFYGCKEVGPNLSVSTSIDTTYVISPVPAADAHNVLIEEFTGQSCPNCPAAHDELVSLAAGGRLNVLGLYCNGITQANPPTGAAYDFRTKVATDISSEIYGGGPLSGIPCGGVDRVSVGGSQTLYSSAWPGTYNDRLNISDSVNLSVSSTYSAADTTAQIIVLVTYLYPTSTQQNLSIAIVEDSITDFQEEPTGVDNTYLFTYVLRDFVSGEPTGDPILPAMTSKEAGRVDQLVYSYKFAASKWNPNHCRVVAFVNVLAPNPQVLQSESTKLVGP